MNSTYVYVATIETGSTLDAAGAVDSNGPITFVSTDRLTALQHAATQILGLATLRYFDEGTVPEEENSHICQELRTYLAANPFPEDDYYDAFELEAWLKQMNEQVNEPWFAIQRLEVLAPRQYVANAAA